MEYIERAKYRKEFTAFLRARIVFGIFGVDRKRDLKIEKYLSSRKRNKQK
jgi:hypothetical protein